jgi:hypothetical protein
MTKEHFWLRSLSNSKPVRRYFIQDQSSKIALPGTIDVCCPAFQMHEAQSGKVKALRSTLLLAFVARIVAELQELRPPISFRRSAFSVPMKSGD